MNGPKITKDDVALPELLLCALNGELPKHNLFLTHLYENLRQWLCSCCHGTHNLSSCPSGVPDCPLRPQPHRQHADIAKAINKIIKQLHDREKYLWGL